MKPNLFGSSSAARISLPLLSILLFGAAVVALCWVLFVVDETGNSGMGEKAIGTNPGVSGGASGDQALPSEEETQAAVSTRESIEPDLKMQGLPFFKEHEDLQGIVIDEAGVPVIGAEVRAVRIETFGRRIPPQAFKVLKTFSVADGCFCFREIPPGRYYLCAKQQGLAGSLSVQAASRDSLPQGVSREREVVLKPSGTIAGRVVDGKGDPIPSALVIPTRAVAAMGVTDREGRFLLDALVKGEHALQVFAQGFAPLWEDQVSTGSSSLELVLTRGGTVAGKATYGGDPVPGVSIVAERQNTDSLQIYRTITGKDGTYSIIGVNSKGHEIRVESPSFCAPARCLFGPEEGERVEGVDFHLLKTGALKGLVRDAETSAPVSGVWVSMVKAVDRYRSTIVDQYPLIMDRANTRTAGNGSFLLSGLAPGAYYLVVQTCPGYVPAIWKRSGQVRVLPGETKEDLLFDLQKGIPVRIVVEGEDGTFLSRAEVILRNPYQGLNTPLSRVASDILPVAEEKGGGEYVFEGLGKGAYEVYAYKRGWVNDSKTLIVEQGEETKTLKIVLAPADRLEGIVVDPDGAGIPDANVTCLSEQTVTDGKGGFVLADLPERRRSITVKAEGYFDLTESDGIDPDGEKLVLTLTPNGAHFIAGQVQDDEGKALPGVSLYLFQYDGKNRQNLNTRSDEDGRFRFEGLGTAEARINVQAVCGAARDRYIKTPVDREDLTVVLDRFTQVKGCVKNAAGEPASYFSISARSEKNRGFSQSAIFEDGTFDLKKVPPGPVTLEAANPEGGEIASQHLELAPGEVRDGITLILQKQCGLEGVVKDEKSGAVLSGVSLWVVDDKAVTKTNDYSYLVRRDPYSVSGQEGDFCIGNLEAGRRVVIAKHPDYAMNASTTVDLFPGETFKDLEILLEKGGTLTGVVFLNGVPESGLRVDAAGKKSGQQYGYTGSDGRYRIEHLCADECRVSVNLQENERGGSTAAKSVCVDSIGEARCDFLLEVGGPLEGRITAEGKPKADVFISLNFKNENKTSDTYYNGWTQTRWDGTYKIAGIPPGLYRFYANSYGGEGLRDSREIEILGPTRLDLDLCNKGTAEVRGFVFENEHPVSGATVSIDCKNHSNQTKTDLSGFYKIGELPEGNAQLSVYLNRGESNNRFQQSTGLTLEPGAVAEEDFHFSMGSGRISGRATCNGEPSERAYVYLTLEEAPSKKAMNINTRCEKGVFLLSGLAPGRYCVKLYDRWWLKQFVDVVDNGETIVEFCYQHGDATLKGSVERKDSKESPCRTYAGLFLPGTCPWTVGAPYQSPGLSEGLFLEINVRSSGSFQQGNLPARAFDLVVVLVKEGKVVGLAAKEVILMDGQTTEAALTLSMEDSSDS